MSNKSKKEVIREVFNSMEYSQYAKPNYKQNSNTKCSTEDVSQLLTQIFASDKWIKLTNEEREKFMNKLALEIQENIDGHSFKESKWSVPFLIDSLRYFGNYCGLLETRQGKRVLACKLSINCSLSLLGYLLSPALTAGYKVIFIAPVHLLSCIKCIELLAMNIGMPEHTISVFEDNIDIKVVLKDVDIFYQFGPDGDNSFHKSIKGIVPSAIPIIVFDNADLDSASDSILSSTWENQLIFDFLPKEIFVQETIYEKFVKKLKDKLLNNKEAAASSNFYETLQFLIGTAEIKGIEIFPPKNGNKFYERNLFIGENIRTKKNSLIAPFLSIVSFRSVNEAVALANNNVQGLSASIWTENIGLGNHVAQKLQVGNVWINSYGLYSLDVAFTPLKFSGKGYFGGIQVLQQLLNETMKSADVTGDEISSEGAETLFLNAVDHANKAFGNWSSLSRQARISKVCSLINFIENNKSNFGDKINASVWVKNWKFLFYQYIKSNYGFSINSPIKGYNLNVSYNPRGVLVLEGTHVLKDYDIRLIIASLIEGNSLVILHTCQQLQKSYEELALQLPVGVLSVVPYSNAIKNFILSKNPMISAYFKRYSLDEKSKLHDIPIEQINETWPDIFNQVTVVKNVWSNIGP